MKILDWNNLSPDEQTTALARPQFSADPLIASRVADILKQVKTEGDEALRALTKQFDGVDVSELRVPQSQLTTALANLDPSLRTAMEQAKANLMIFHRAELPKPFELETMPGVSCGLQWRPLDIVGLYIPGGTAPLFSTVLMLAVVAKLAGCSHIILCSPPQKNGEINPAILAAAQLCGIDEVYAVGGAQAIAAMAFGTASIPKADKIFGPGNAYVTMAKQLVAQDPQGAAIDMPAGPSEVMVIAEKSHRADWVAADLLAQAEHDTVAQAILVTTDQGFAEQVKAEIGQQLANLPRREIAAKSLDAGRALVVADMAMALAVANRYAPEHLILHHENAETYLPQIRHAGSVFLGATTPESAGDYASGTNHVLPTYGYARSYGGVTVLSFMKSMSVQKITPVGLQALGPAIMTMAQAEGLDAHANAVATRLERK